MFLFYRWENDFRGNLIWGYLFKLVVKLGLDFLSLEIIKYIIVCKLIMLRYCNGK